MTLTNRRETGRQVIDVARKWQALGFHHRGANQLVNRQTGPGRPSKTLGAPVRVANPAPRRPSPCAPDGRGL